MTVFDDMAATLLASPLAVTVTFYPQGLPGVTVQALLGGRDMEGRLGPVRARQDVMELMIRWSDLSDPPVRDDEFEHDGKLYRVTSDAPTDERRLWWYVAGYEVGA